MRRIKSMDSQKTVEITVEVAYATPERQYITQVVITPETPLIEAVKLSRISDIFPDLDLSAADFGIWGKVVKPLHTPMKNGQRIEIYRPLIADPKESRRKRAEKK